jgi:hypothetical protein
MRTWHSKRAAFGSNEENRVESISGCVPLCGNCMRTFISKSVAYLTKGKASEALDDGYGIVVLSSITLPPTFNSKLCASSRSHFIVRAS